MYIRSCETNTMDYGQYILWVAMTWEDYGIVSDGLSVIAMIVAIIDERQSYVP